MTAALARSTLLAFSLLSPLTAHANCDDDMDACVRLVVAETASFIEACGNHYPELKADFNRAFQHWNVLQLPIPALQDALNLKAETRLMMDKATSLYLQRIPSYRREIECFGRFEMIKSATPQLRGDSAQLPTDALQKYLQ